MAAVPDFGALAQQQSAANNAATNATNTANRPNQYGSMGSSTWSMGPNGQWTNTLDLADPQQNLFNTTIAGQQNLGNQIAGGVNFGALPTMPDSGFGASQQVIDAWNALQQPGLTKSADAARARAAAMGITLGSNANNDIERTIGVNESTARNEGILRGTQEYQNVFNRGLASRQQAEKEAMDQYSSAISGSASLGSTRDSLNPNKWLSTNPTSAAYLPQQIYGAALDTFSANQANENAARSQSNADRSALMSGVNTGLGVAGQIGWGNIWGGAKDLWNWASGSGNNNLVSMDDWDYLSNQ